MIKNKLAKVLSVLTTTMLVVLMMPASSAFAALTVGPVDPVSVWPAAPAGVATGFPAWYADATGIKLALIPITGNGAAAPTQTFTNPDPANPYSVFLGFDLLASYFDAKAVINTPNGRATYSASLDAAFPATKGVKTGATPGQEIVQQTITVKMPLVAGQEGTYNIQEPYGKNTVVVTAAEIAAGKGLKFGLTVPAAAAPRVFTGAFGGPITAFLKPTAAPPPGWLGDGATVSTVTGSPTGFNSVTISGPAGTFTTNQFTISGRLFTQVAPVASFTVTPAGGAAPITVNFADTSVGPATSWVWNFGDGSPTATVQNPSHVYLTAGNFTVTETVTNAVGTASTTQVVAITPGVSAIPVAAFNTNLATGPAPLTVNFTDITTGVPTAWSWNFGDGSPVGTIQNPSHVFLTSGTFTVAELVTNALGSSSASKIITVTPPVPAVPVASFSMTPTTGAPPLTVQFTDITTGVPTAWSWNFGDGSPVSTVQNPSHVFAAAGTFAISETASNALGTSSATHPVTVTGVPAIAAPLAPTTLAATVISSTQVNLTWMDNANDETLFMVQRAPDTTFTTGLVELHPPANTAPAPATVSFSDITAVAATTYSYRVLSVNLIGNSVPTNVVTVTTMAAGAPVPQPVPPPAPAVAQPAPPVGGGGGGGGGGGAPPAPVFSPVSLTGFLSSTGLNTDATGKVQLDAQVKTANDDVVLNLPAGTMLTDINGAKIASLSATLSSSSPAAPAGGKIIKSYVLGPDGAQFSPGAGLTMRFDPAKLPAGFAPNQLLLEFFDGANWVNLAGAVDTAANSISAQITHFTEFAIIAPAATATPPATPAPAPAPAKAADAIVAPSVPQDLAATVNADGMVFLTWSQDLSNQTGFMIERAADKEFTAGEVEFHAPAKTASFTDITVTAGKTYFYRVIAVTSVGHSESSNVVSVTTGAGAAPPPATPEPTSTTPAATPAAPTPASPAQAASSGSNLGMIIGIIVGVLVVVGLAVFLMRKKPAA